MSADTSIEWCDHTFNPWEGCQKVSPGCDNCYAEARNARFAGGTAVNWGPGAPRRRTSAANWNLPKRWNAQADAFMAQHGRRQRVFCASLADVFDNAVDPQWRADLFSLIQQTPNLDWLLLTKRIGNVRGMLAELAHGNDPDLSLLDMMPLPNVWIGATIVNQAEADRDIPKLLEVPAAKRFLSMEPLLGPVQLTSSGLIPADEEGPVRIGYMAGPDDGKSGLWPTPEQALGRSGLHWVIVGGESGPNARPMHPDWARSLRDQCEAAGVPFLFKQWGSYTLHEVAHDGVVEPSMPMDFNGLRHWTADGWEIPAPDTPAFLVMRPGAVLAMPANKKHAGRLLDGRTWDGFPS